MNATPPTIAITAYLPVHDKSVPLEFHAFVQTMISLHETGRVSLHADSRVTASLASTGSEKSKIVTKSETPLFLSSYGVPIFHVVVTCMNVRDIVVFEEDLDCLVSMLTHDRIVPQGSCVDWLLEKAALYRQHYLVGRRLDDHETLRPDRISS